MVIRLKGMKIGVKTWNDSNFLKNFEKDDLFLINPNKINDRIDVFFHQPSYRRLVDELYKSKKAGKCELKKGPFGWICPCVTEHRQANWSEWKER